VTILAIDTTHTNTEKNPMHNLNEESLLDYLAHRYTGPSLVFPSVAVPIKKPEPPLEQDVTPLLVHPLSGMELPLKHSGYNKKRAPFVPSLKPVLPVES
jgi:hypothetical protein